jgi:hypothetical protein
VRVRDPQGHKVNLIGRLLNLPLSRRKVGMLQWSGHCALCKRTYRFTAEGILASVKDKEK